LLIKLECHLQFVSLYAVGLYTYLILLFIFAIFSFILFLLYQVLPKKKSNFFFFLGSLKSLKKKMILFFIVISVFKISPVLSYSYTFVIGFLKKIDVLTRKGFRVSALVPCLF